MSHYSCKQYLQLRQIEVGKSPILEMCFYPLYKLFSQQRYQSISNRLANGVSILDFWQKTLKTSPTVWQTTWQNIATWQKLSLTAHIWQLGKSLTTKIKSSLCLHAAYCLFFILPSPKQQIIEEELFFYLANSFGSWQITRFAK